MIFAKRVHKQHTSVCMLWDINTRFWNGRSLLKSVRIQPSTSNFNFQFWKRNHGTQPPLVQRAVQQATGPPAGHQWSCRRTPLEAKSIFRVPASLAANCAERSPQTEKKRSNLAGDKLRNISRVLRWHVLRWCWRLHTLSCAANFASRCAIFKLQEVWECLRIRHLAS